MSFDDTHLRVVRDAPRRQRRGNLVPANPARLPEEPAIAVG